jgi:protein O-GlcNAc transferase
VANSRPIRCVDAARFEDTGACGILFARLMSSNENAIDLYRRAMRPFERGDYGAAIPLLRKALNAAPGHTMARFNLGVALHETKRLGEAIAQYQKALAGNPLLARAHNNIGLALQALGRTEEAVIAHRRAVDIDPRYANALNNLGVALHDSGRHAAAVEAFAAALTLRPDYADAWNNRGNAIAALGHFREAIDCYEKTLALNPDDIDAQTNRGVALSTLGCLDEAVEALRRALRLRPDHSIARSYLTHCLRFRCDWTYLAELEARLIEDAGTGIVVPHHLLSTIDDPALQQACARRYASRALAAAPLPVARTAVPRERLKIGYLSADFREHPVAYLIAELFERHDRRRFEVTGYSIGPPSDGAMRRRLVAGFDRFVDLRELTDRDAAARIAADGTDILVDLMGHTHGARTRILACQAAPVQVNLLGYPGTIGAPCVDYIIADPVVVPAGEEAFFDERLVRLPHCFQPNDSKRAIADAVPSRTECGLPERGFVFCCFNAAYKLSPSTFDIWMRLLAAVPTSVLWLREAEEKSTGDNLRREALARGVPAERLVFAPRVAFSEHLARIRIADLFLDTFPYNAHATASDALWAGLPVLSLAGRGFASRVAASLLQAIGLPELVTTSPAEYEAIALRLAADPDGLANLRRRLAANRATAPLFDPGRYAASLEWAFEEMWRIHTSGAAPSPFAVPARG